MWGNVVEEDICLAERFAYRGSSRQTLDLQYSPLEDSGRANPAKAKQFAFAPVVQRTEC